MELVNIDNIAHPLYDSFAKLYSTAFPIFEQRTEAQQTRAFSHPKYHLSGYKEDNIFIGFISYWNFQEYIYIEHFAIDRQLRGSGYGSQILKDFISRESKIVLLEIDPITDDISRSRLRFYQKCGFYENPYPHIHPPYRDGYKGHELLILSSPQTISPKGYDMFQKDLHKTVMGDKQVEDHNRPSSA